MTPGAYVIGYRITWVLPADAQGSHRCSIFEIHVKEHCNTELAFYCQWQSSVLQCATTRLKYQAQYCPRGS